VLDKARSYLFPILPTFSQLAHNFFSCCGAGTAADTDMTTQLISSNLELHSLSTGRLPRVATANRMLKQMLFR